MTDDAFVLFVHEKLTRIERWLEQIATRQPSAQEQHALELNLEIMELAKDTQLRARLREEAHAAACPTCQAYATGQKGQLLASILLFVPSVDRALADGKCYFLGRWLTEAGHSPLFLIWDQPSEDALKQLQFPYVRLFPKKLDVQVRQEAEKALALMTKPICEGNGSVPVPTYGDLLVFDDFLGTAQAWDFPGANFGRPDVVITSVPGLESACPEDASLSLAVHRFAVSNHIPVLGIEFQSLQNQQHLQARPLAFLLTKGDPRTYPEPVQKLAPVVFPLPVPHRYCFRLGQDLSLQSFLQEEAALRKNLNLTGSERFLYLPMHLGWKTDIIKQLQVVNHYAPSLIQAGFELLITTNPGTVRRSYHEHDIVRAGILPKWADAWRGRWRIADAGAPFAFALLSEAALMPWDGALRELLETWGLPLIRPGEESQLDNLACGVSVVQAVDYLLKQNGGDGHGPEPGPGTHQADDADHPG